MAESFLHEKDMFGVPVPQKKRGKVSDKFIIPPFSVLNSRDGYWQKRKRMWKGLGIRGEIGRLGTKEPLPVKKNNYQIFLY